MKRLGESDAAYRARARREFGETMADQTRRVAARWHADALGDPAGRSCDGCNAEAGEPCRWGCLSRA